MKNPSWVRILCAGFPNFLFSMVAIPLFLILPNYYFSNFSISLTTIGMVIFLSRFLDALIDPFLGTWSDRLAARSPRSLNILVSLIIAPLSVLLLLYPLVSGEQNLLVWLFVFSIFSYLSFGFGTINLQAWMNENSGSDAELATMTSMREFMGILGILVSSVLLSQLIEPRDVLKFVLPLSILAILSILIFPRENIQRTPVMIQMENFNPILVLRDKFFKFYLKVFFLSSLSTAFTSSLFLIFIEQILKPAIKKEVYFLSYFLAGIIGTLVLQNLYKKMSFVRVWRLGLIFSTLSFSLILIPGFLNEKTFLLVCILSGLTLGVDLTISSFVVKKAKEISDLNLTEGVYFGTWSFVSKFALSVAALIALPSWGAIFTYLPSNVQNTGALILYCLVPCGLRMGAFYLLNYKNNVEV